jgi:hypothetical protein
LAEGSLCNQYNPEIVSAIRDTDLVQVPGLRKQAANNRLAIASHRIYMQ